MGVYNLISGISMLVFWGAACRWSWVPRDNALILPEVLTMLLLSGSGIVLLLKKARGEKLALLALGMLVYAVILACGKFAGLDQWGFAIFFGVISIASAVIAVCSVFTSGE
jgi:hypothetical protein